MKAKLPIIARVLLGLPMVVFGLMGLLNLMPPPPDLPENLKTFMAGMMATQYLFPLVKLTETICGLAILTGFFVPLALVVLAPVMLNIVLVNAFMTPSQLALPIVLGLLTVYLAFFTDQYSPKIKALFSNK